MSFEEKKDELGELKSKVEELRGEKEGKIEKKEGEKTLESVLEGLENKKKEIVDEMRQKFPKEMAGLYDNIIEGTYGPMKRLVEYGNMTEDEIDKYVEAEKTPSDFESGMYLRVITNKKFRLKDKEDVLLLGGFNDRDQVKDNFKKRREAGELYSESIALGATKEGRKKYFEYIKEEAKIDDEEKHSINILREKFKWITDRCLFLSNYGFNKENIGKPLSRAENLSDLGFAGHMFEGLQDIMDLNEAGAINFDKMGGSERRKLYENAKIEIGKPEVFRRLGDLRDAYKYGIIDNRQEYLDLIKQANEQAEEKVVNKI